MAGGGSLPLSRYLQKHMLLQIRVSSIRNIKFAAFLATIVAPTCKFNLLIGLCDSHRSQDGAHLGPPSAGDHLPRRPPFSKSKRSASVRKGPFTSSPAPVGAPTRACPLLTGLCDSHRSQDGAHLGPPQRPNPGIIQNFPKAHSYPWVMFTNCKHLLLRLILISGDQFIAISSVAL